MWYYEWVMKKTSKLWKIVMYLQKQECDFYFNYKFFNSFSFSWLLQWKPFLKWWEKYIWTLYNLWYLTRYIKYSWDWKKSSKEFIFNLTKKWRNAIFK